MKVREESEENEMEGRENIGGRRKFREELVNRITRLYIINGEIIRNGIR